jgi:hypothetical protein
MAEETKPPQRADVLSRAAAPDLYELGGEFLSRMNRVLQAYLGVDPQQFSQIPRYQLAKYVVPALTFADLNAPPWRKIGKAVMLADPQPSSANQAGTNFINVPGSNIAFVVDWIDVTLSVTGRFHIGYTSAGNPTQTPAAQKFYSVEDQPQKPQSANFVFPSIPVSVKVVGNQANGTLQVDGTDFQRIWIGGGVANQVTRVIFTDVVVWPGVGLETQSISANTGVDSVCHGRIFDLSQIGTQNFTA